MPDYTSPCQFRSSRKQVPKWDSTHKRFKQAQAEKEREKGGQIGRISGYSEEENFSEDGSFPTEIICWRSPMSHRNGLALGPTLCPPRGKTWHPHKCSGGSRGLAAGAISQLCFLQQQV